MMDTKIAGSMVEEMAVQRLLRLKPFKAVGTNGNLCTVLAADADDAFGQAWLALCKAGREQALAAWQANGCKVVRA